MIGARAHAGAVCAAVFLLLTGCTSTPGGAGRGVERTEQPPEYAEVAQQYNERLEDLRRVWARAVVQIRYRDQDGRQRSEQGEGHLQFVAPSRLALSVGKLGEVLFYMGTDGDRFWWFERGDADRLTVGRHENLGQPCAQRVSLPAQPVELLDLLGLTPLPVSASGQTSWSARGELLVDAPTATAFQRLVLDPDTLEPLQIGVYSFGGRSPRVIAKLENYERISIRGRPGYTSRAPGRILVQDRESDAEVRITLYGVSDGDGGRRLPDDAFNLSSLIDAFAPATVDVLDADCATPAIPRAAAHRAGRSR